MKAKVSRLYLVVLVLLMLPVIQGAFGWIPLEELHGSSERKEPMEFEVSRWWSGEYQENSNARMTQNFGFRSEFVRLSNTMNFLFFHELNAAEVVEGKNGVLYEYKYIESYTGKEKIDEQAMDEKLRQIKELQAYFQERGKLFGVVLYPGKATFYPEYFPDTCGTEAARTNYKLFVEKSKLMEVDIVDMNAWFKGMKSTSKAPLFTNIGIHWSQYGACLATDSLLNYMPRMLKRDMNHFDWNRDQVDLRDEVHFPDNDMEQALNIYVKLDHPLLAYPNMVPQTADRFRPRVSLFSDSFFFNILTLGWEPSIFSRMNMYYYNRVVYHADGSTTPVPELKDKMATLAEDDAIFILATEYNMDEIGWNIVQEAYDYFILNKRD